MSQDAREHRLAALFSADAAGYTRLIAEDESSTIRAIADARSRIGECVGRHGGRLVDAPGDNLLAEFPSALAAVLCAVEAQRSLADRAAAQPPERRLLFRIGLHVGEVTVDDGRLYGDGVNVAARLQALAEPGAICLSAAVHENVAARLDLPFRDLGEQSLKNFPRPVRAFGLGEGGVTPADVAASVPVPEPPPDGASLVVLPFANVSGDAEQEYLADGMSEDLIAELARVPGLFVIGRGTSFSYKGRSVDGRELGRALGVQYLVEGSVRRAGPRVRITARLTDARSGREVWSARFDRELGDVFALQDEVVGGVVAELRRALGAGFEFQARERLVRGDAWGLLVQGRAQVEQNRPDAARAGRELLQRCVALDPELASGWAELAHSESALYFLGAEDEAAIERGFADVRRALEIDPADPVAHLVLGSLHSNRGEADRAVAAGRRALELAPGRADVRLRFATLLGLLGHSEEAIPILRGLTRLDPALRYAHLFQLAVCYRRQGRLDEAIAKHRESLAAHPDFLGSHMNLAALYTELGELNLARASLAELMRVRPDFSIARIPRLPTGRDFLVENLRKAGVREE